MLEESAFYLVLQQWQQHFDVLRHGSYSPGWPGTACVAHHGASDPTASTSWVLGAQVCTTRPYWEGHPESVQNLLCVIV